MDTKKQSVEPLSAEKNFQEEVLSQRETTTFPAYIGYPPADDIYYRDKQEPDINPENINTKKVPNELSVKPKESAFSNDFDGDDLDIPGVELDDDNEDIGAEDEENNYYSIGGDNHNELEEDSND